MKKFLFSLALAAIAASSLAQDIAGEFQLGIGQHDNHRRLSLGYQSEPVWTSASGQASLSWQPEIAFWETRNRNANGQNHLWQFTLNPVLTWRFNDAWYAEGGIGLTYLMDNQFDDKKFGSRLNFSDNIGFGYRLNQQTSIAYRFSHYSNAGLDKPNPGLDSHQVMVSMKF